MKPRTILAILTLLISGFAQAQSAYYDALKLRSLARQQGSERPLLFSKKDAEHIYPILVKYTKGIATGQALSDAYARNPFITVEKTGDTSLELSPEFAAGGLISKVGGLDVTKLADGLGKFLASRAKEEMNVAFFERFRELLRSHPEISHLFPVTTKYLDHIYNYEYSNMLSTLRAAFESDLIKLPTNIVSIAEIEISECGKCKNGRTRTECEARLKCIRDAFYTDAGLATITGLLIVDGVLEKSNPAEVLSAIAGNVTIAALKTDGSAKADIYHTLRLLDIMSSGLRSSEASKVWISKDELNALQNDAVLFRIFAGLLYQQIASENITIAEVRIRDYFTPAQLTGFKQYLNNVVGAAEQIAASFRSITAVDTGAEARLRVKSMVLATRSFLSQATRYSMIHPAIPSPDERVKQIIYYTDQSLVIVEHILARDYYNAVLNTALILEDILKSSEHFDSKGRFRSSVTASNMDSALNKKEFVASVLKYGNFMANVVYAESSDDVKKSVEAVALPPGASIIKKATNFSVAVQAYTGLTYGTISNSEHSSNTAGIYAPVGVSFSTGLKSRRNPYDKRSYGSVSAMFSLIDVGAIVAYRFNDAESQLADTVAIRLENIFAPGLNVVYGVPKVPLSIGAGFQWQPSLLRLSNENATLSEKSGWRWHVFLALDLPLLHIHSSKR